MPNTIDVPRHQPTIMAAHDAAASGDTIRVNAKEYAEAIATGAIEPELIRVTKPGLRFEADGYVELSGQGHTLPRPNVAPRPKQSVDFPLYEFSYAPLVSITASDIYFGGFGITESGGAGITLIDGKSAFDSIPHSDVLIERCRIHNNRHSGLRSGQVSNLVIRGCELFRNCNFAPGPRSPSRVLNHPHNLNLKHGKDIVVEDCIIYNNWGEGWGFTDTDGALFWRNTVCDNYAMGGYGHYARDLQILENNFIKTASAEFWRNDGVPSPCMAIHMENDFDYSPHGNIRMADNLFVGHTERSLGLWGNQNVKRTGPIDAHNNTFYVRHVGGKDGVIDSNGRFNDAYEHLDWYNNVVIRVNDSLIGLVTIPNGHMADNVSADYNVWSHEVPSNISGPNDVIADGSILEDPTLDITDHHDFDRSRYYVKIGALPFEAGIRRPAGEVIKQPLSEPTAAQRLDEAKRALGEMLIENQLYSADLAAIGDIVRKYENAE